MDITLSSRFFPQFKRFFRRGRRVFLLSPFPFLLVFSQFKRFFGLFLIPPFHYSLPRFSPVQRMFSGGISLFSYPFPIVFPSPNCFPSRRGLYFHFPPFFSLPCSPSSNSFSSRRGGISRFSSPTFFVPLLNRFLSGGIILSLSLLHFFSSVQTIFLQREEGGIFLLPFVPHFPKFKQYFLNKRGDVSHFPRHVPSPVQTIFPRKGGGGNTHPSIKKCLNCV